MKCIFCNESNIESLNNERQFVFCQKCNVYFEYNINNPPNLISIEFHTTINDDDIYIFEKYYPIIETSIYRFEWEYILLAKFSGKININPNNIKEKIKTLLLFS